MAKNARPTPESYYYSGQGRLGIGDRDPETGAFSNVIFPGNVTSLTVDISTDKTEHKESMTGQRTVDRTIITQKNATFSFTAESLSKQLMSTGLFGTFADVVSGTVTDEAHTVGDLGSAIPLKYPNVSTVVITMDGGTGTPAIDVDYEIDHGFGTIYVKPGSTVLIKGAKVKVAYEYGKHTRIDAFTQGTPPERYLRFEGLNTDNGDLVMLEIPRAAFDPVTGREYINEEFGTAEFQGNILLDTTITEQGRSQFFRETRVAVADFVNDPDAP